MFVLFMFMVKFISRLSLSFPSVASGNSGGATFQTPSARYDAQAELCSRLFALGEKATCKERRRSRQKTMSSIAVETWIVETEDSG